MLTEDHSYYIDNAPFGADELGVLEIELREAIYSCNIQRIRELILGAGILKW